jgi:hypothetical protein
VVPGSGYVPFLVAPQICSFSLNWKGLAHSGNFCVLCIFLASSPVYRIA